MTLITSQTLCIGDCDDCKYQLIPNDEWIYKCVLELPYVTDDEEKTPNFT